MTSEQSALFDPGFEPAKEIADDPVGAIALYAVPGVGSARYRALLKAFGSPSGVFKAGAEALSKVPGLDSKTAAAIAGFQMDGSAEKMLAKLRSCQARIISIWDETYPERLKQIHDPPALLFLRGELPAQDEISIAIVGTRTPSEYGLQQAFRIAEGLAQQGVSTVSGMARGVDSAAHKGCLEGGGKTYAVFGCGIDVIYPRENKSLAAKIEASGGLISEFLPGMEPDRGLFPRRNRVISGLCEGVLVVEGGEKSGALITARCALEQNREVFALPGSVDQKVSSGPHQLIRQGATLAVSAQDILDGIGVQFNAKQVLSKTRSLPTLNPSEEELIKKLSTDPIHIDHLVRDLGKPVSSVLADLLSLEMKGWVMQLPGKLFAFRRP